ncbi:hypothetical protein SAMN05216227_1002113 [Pseudorhodobacter antarcticus]|jgi:hypothetical protein|uniref:Uncharacterized protein n=1 Tax=Pseudorhodobacter antarcticus TaxID=1077947 RepID=A0A1H8B3W4_9RHOB|nr:hypothetical protein [Pseudorhodobacter antarcticus]SEM77591.1 hypothetical protein SAMN05216227_1002113 [Pseudorhodobacter antarcticus]
MGSLFALGTVLVIYVSLATLPKGPPAVMGLVLAGGLILLGYLIAPNAGHILTLALVGAGMAAAAQAMRRFIPQRLYLPLLGVLPLLLLSVLLVITGA